MSESEANNKIDKKIFHVSYIRVLLVMGILLLLNFFLSLITKDIGSILIGYLTFTIINAITPLVAMVINRLVTTRWGKYLNGLLIFNFLNFLFIGIILILLSNNSLWWIILFIFYLIAGIIFFSRYERFVKFTNDPLKINNDLSKVRNITFHYAIVIFNFIKIYTKKCYIFLKEKARTGYNKLELFIRESKCAKPAGLGIAVLIVLLIFYKLFVIFFCVTVKSYSPAGETQQQAAIVVEFSDAVFLAKEDIEPVYVDIKRNDKQKGNSAEQEQETNNIQFLKSGISVLNITPAVSGSCRIEDNKTLVFVPDKELKPSTEYTVKVDTAKLHSRKFAILGNTFNFNTPYFNVISTNIFDTDDLVENSSKEYMLEINFNSPVDPKELVKNICLSIDGEPAKISLEPSTVPMRYYFKTDPVKTEDKDKKIKLTVQKGLNCINGNVPLLNNFKETYTLNAEKKFEVLSAESFPAEGDTFIVALFNMPVSPEMIQKYLSIKDSNDAPVAFTVETEYCYAVLKGKFEYGMKYSVSVKEGMIAQTGKKLKNSADYDVTIQDLPAKVSFTSRGTVLPRRGPMDIELYTQSLDSFDVKIDKVFKNNLVYFLHRGESSEYAATLLMKNVTVTEGQINQRISHFINLRSFYEMEYKGLFSIRLSDTKDYGNYDQQNILCTDIGIIAQESGKDLIVKVYSISELMPLPGVIVKILSNNNQIIKESISQETGTCIFQDYKINKQNFAPYVLLAEKDDDYSYLQFSNSIINTTRFDVGGEMGNEKGLKAFLTPERGVYRPREKAYISAIVRTSDLNPPPPIDVQLCVTDPSGERLTLKRQKVPASGMLSFDIAIPSYAKTGTYSIDLRLNDEVIIGRSSLKIEEFITDKIKAEIITSTTMPKPGKPITFSVKGTQLFGPPAAGRKVWVKVKFDDRTFEHPAFDGYSFRDITKEHYAGQVYESKSEVLNDKGLQEYDVSVPPVMSPPSALVAKIFAEVSDIDGRSVSAAKSIPIDYYSTYIGLRIDGKDRFYENQPVGFSYVAVDPFGKYKKAEKAKITIRHRIYYSILRKHGISKSNEDSNENYDSEAYHETVVNKDITVNQKGYFTFTPKAPGEYTIYVYEKQGMRTSEKIFVNGPGVISTNLKSAENLTVTLNKEKYSAGEAAIVTVNSPIPGRLIYSIEREKVMYSNSVMLVNNSATIAIPVGPDFVPNVYFTALVIRKPDPSLRKLPMSSMGIKNIALEPGNRKMAVVIESVDETRSDNGLTVRSKAEPGASVVIAAVDEGILQITQFQTPDPFNFFYLKRALQTKLYSIFNAVLPAIKAPKLAIGGDGEGYLDESRRHINPISANRVKSISLYSGILTADASGYAQYHFNIPEFNGRLRVMAITANQNRFGSASKYVTVSDPIVITASFPRILAPDDNVEIPMAIYNKTGKAGTAIIKLTVNGPVQIKGNGVQSVVIKNQSEAKIYFYCKARNDAGKADFTITASLNNQTVTNKIELAVRPSRSLSTIVESGSLKSGMKANINVPGGFIPYGQRIRLFVSPKFVTQFLAGMDYLIQYPYGCAEQTASSAFPLLYFRDLAETVGYFNKSAGDFERYVNTAIERIEKMYLSQDQFSMWPGGTSSNPYVSYYVSHFLIEARNRGYEVNESLWKKITSSITGEGVAKARLDRRKNYSWEDIDIYRLYLKALLGKPDMESMNYIKVSKLKELSYEDQCRLADCYAVMGDKETAKAILPAKFLVEYFPRIMNGNYDSVVKRLSIYCMTLCRIDPADPRCLKVAEEISKHALKNRGDFGTTHDNTYALMAISEAYKQEAAKEIKASILVEGKPYKEISDKKFSIEDNTLSGKKITLQNNSSENIYYNLMAEGTPASNIVKPALNGLSISRRYYTKDGDDINLSNVAQGDLIVAVISLDPKGKYDNLVVVDLIPAGFEIENMRLKSRGNLGYTPPNNWVSAYEDIRDDRLLLFTGSVSGKIEFSYTLRAVSVGKFIIPQTFAEAMYNPDINATDESLGSVNVVRTGN